MEFIITNSHNKVIETNITNTNLIQQILTCNKSTEIINCPVLKRKRRQGVSSLPNFSIYLSSDDTKITNKIFKHYLDAFKLLAEDVVRSIETAVNKESQKTRRLKHNLINHNTNILQEIYKLVSQDQFKNGNNHQDVIQGMIQKDTRKAAYAFLKVLKYSNLMKAEFDVYEMLDQDNPFLDFTEHPLHKVVILTINPFWLDLIEKKVVITIQQFTERITIDYKSVSVALSHIFDNATKYVLPYSEFRITFENYLDHIVIKFDMISLKVEHDELESIFKENVSGKWALRTNLSGDGIGMFMIRKLIRLNRGEVIFKVNADPSRNVIYDNLPYENNVIQIIIKK